MSSLYESSDAEPSSAKSSKSSPSSSNISKSSSSISSGSSSGSSVKDVSKSLKTFNKRYDSDVKVGDSVASVHLLIKEYNNKKKAEKEERLASFSDIEKEDEETDVFPYNGRLVKGDIFDDKKVVFDDKDNSKVRNISDEIKKLADEDIGF